MPLATSLRISTLFTSRSRSWRSNCRDETLTRGEDRRIDVERPLPGGEFARRALQREQAEIDDEAGLLGDRHELARLEPAETRMVPAQQRLEAGDGAILEPHDRLEEHLDLAALQRAAQLGLERQPVGALRRASTGGTPRCDCRRRAWRERMAISASSSMSSRSGCSCGSNRAMPIETRERDLPVGEASPASPARGARESASVITWSACGLGDENDGESVAGDARQRVLRLQEARRADARWSAGSNRRWRRRPAR